MAESNKSRKKNGGVFGWKPCSSSSCKKSPPDTDVMGIIAKRILIKNILHLVATLPTGVNTEPSIKKIVNYLLDSVTDRNKYITNLINKKSETFLLVIYKNYKNPGDMNKQGNYGFDETDYMKITNGTYNETIWVLYNQLLKTKMKLCKDKDKENKDPDFKIIEEILNKIIEGINNLDILSDPTTLIEIETILNEKNLLNDITRVGGNKSKEVTQFKKLLRKHKILLENIPKTYLLKKSDLKAEKIYIVRAPTYEKVVLLKDKSTFDTTVRWIKVNDKSLRWFEKRILLSELHN